METGLFAIRERYQLAEGFALMFWWNVRVGPPSPHALRKRAQERPLHSKRDQNSRNARQNHLIEPT